MSTFLFPRNQLKHIQRKNVTKIGVTINFSSKFLLEKSPSQGNLKGKCCYTKKKLENRKINFAYVSENYASFRTIHFSSHFWKEGGGALQFMSLSRVGLFHSCLKGIEHIIFSPNLCKINPLKFFSFQRTL